MLEVDVLELGERRVRSGGQQLGCKLLALGTVELLHVTDRAGSNRPWPAGDELTVEQFKGVSHVRRKGFPGTWWSKTSSVSICCRLPGSGTNILKRSELCGLRFLDASANASCLQVGKERTERSLSVSEEVAMANAAVVRVAVREWLQSKGCGRFIITTAVVRVAVREWLQSKGCGRFIITRRRAPRATGCGRGSRRPSCESGSQARPKAWHHR